jgi:copper chaperone CopZ
MAESYDGKGILGKELQTLATDIATDLNDKQPSRLVVSSDDNTAFSKISAAIAAGKDVWLNTNATYSGATYSHYVPLTEAVFRSGSYTAFIFSRSRAYSDENGIVDRWTCNSSSWTYETESVAYAATAGTAGTAGTVVRAGAAGTAGDGKDGAASLAGGQDNDTSSKEDQEMTEKKLSVEGMMCEHCVAHVKEALEGVRGVENVVVNLCEGTATLDAGLLVRDDDLVKAVEEAGYKAHMA